MLRALLYALTFLSVMPAPAHAQAGDEVPFVVTPDNVTIEMLRLAGVGPRDYVIDLGSGDGRIVITAARRFGARGLGVELVADLVARSRAAAARAGVGGRAEFREQDLFKTDLAPATVITMYLLQEVNLQLRPSLLALAPGTRIVSHDWDMGDWPPDRSVSVPAPEKTVGLEKRSRLHLWVVPARLQGLWCGRDGRSLELKQRYQAVDATWRDGDRSATWQGRIDGSALRLLGGTSGSVSLRLQGEELRVISATKAPSIPGANLRRAVGDRCP